MTPASSSKSLEEESQKDSEGEGADASLLADDYVDPQQMQQTGGAMDEFASEAKMMPQSDQGQNMHVSMMQVRGP